MQTGKSLMLSPPPPLFKVVYFITLRRWEEPNGSNLFQLPQATRPTIIVNTIQHQEHNGEICHLGIEANDIKYSW